jgi:hypothetical protein
MAYWLAYAEGGMFLSQDWGPRGTREHDVRTWNRLLDMTSEFRLYDARPAPDGVVILAEEIAEGHCV